MWRVLKNRRLWIGLVIVGGLVAVAVWPRAIEVDFTVVTRGPLVVTIDEEGVTRVRDRFVVTAPVAGDLARIALEPGDAVRKGQTLLTLRPATPVPLDARTRAEIEAGARSAEALEGRARAERDRAASAATLAEQRAARARALLGGGAVAREEVEARDAEARSAADALRSAEFAIAQARQELQAMRARLGQLRAGEPQPDFVVVSPIDGLVLRRPQQSARVVAPGEPLLEVGDPARMEIVADLLSSDAVRVGPGAAVVIEQWGGPTPLRGCVRRIEPSGFTKVSALGVEEQRVNVIIDFESPLDERRSLGDGYRVEVKVVTWKADDVLKVPVGALFREADEWAVFVAAGDRAARRRVQIGQRSGLEAQVVGGLADGDQVIVYPPDTVADGIRVTPRAR
jgi:HlyD family secretion protein